MQETSNHAQELLARLKGLEVEQAPGLLLTLVA